MADPAPSEDAPAPSDKALADKTPATAEAGRPQMSPKVDGTAFANTKEHVASRQGDGATVERFTNTKLNIALINDPKNGPRFTMTKRESGLDDKGEADRSPDGSAPSADETVENAPSTAPDMTEQPDAKEAPLSGAGPDAADGDINASGSPPWRSADTAETRQPGVETATAAALLAKPAPSGVPPAAVPPSKTPIDSSKTFVGHNGTYYDESWRWMDWRGTRQSWNWPAALSLGHWFAYRRLYGFAALYLGLLAGLVAATVNDIPLLAVVALAVLIVGLAGVYGNTLYFLAFRRAVDHVTKTGEGSYEELRSQLAKAGGTSVTALSVMAVLSITSIIAALAVTYYMRGGFFLNLWPF